MGRKDRKISKERRGNILNADIPMTIPAYYFTIFFYFNKFLKKTFPFNWFQNFLPSVIIDPNGQPVHRFL